MYQLSKDDLPNIFPPILALNSVTHSYLIRQRDNIHLPHSEQLLHKKELCIPVSLLRMVWVSEVKEVPSLNYFKRKLRAFLLNSCI